MKRSAFCTFYRHLNRTLTPCFLFGVLQSSAVFADSMLVEAAQNSDAGTVERLLASGVDVDSPYSDGSTALLWAAHNNDVALVRILLAAGADPKASNDYEVSAVSEAAMNGNAAMLELFLKAGLDPDEVVMQGETPLMTAAKVGSAEAVRILLENGADVNHHEQWRGQTALMWAAAENHSEIVELLIDAGAELDAKSREFDFRELKIKPGSVAMHFPRGGFTALLFAARNGAMESAELLLDAGADLNLTDPDSTSPLLMSIINFNYDLALLLIERGAQINIVDDRGRGALYAAVDMRRLDRSNRPVPTQTDEHSPMDVIVALINNDQLQVDAELNQYLRPRAVLDGADSTLNAGTTALIRAARGGDVEVMRLLVDAGADPHHVLDDGTTALMIASGQGFRDGNTNNTLKNMREAVAFLMAQGAEIQASNDKGLTALHSAASRGADDVISYLVENGADLYAQDEEGNTALDTASGVGGKLTPLYSTVELLQSLMQL